MSLFFSHARRRPLGTVLLCCLLALGLAAACIGTAAQTTTAVQLQQLEANHTTIALANGMTPEQYTTGLENMVDIPLINPDGSFTVWHFVDVPGGRAAQATDDSYPGNATLFRFGGDAPQTKQTVNAAIMAGHLTDGVGLSSGSIDPTAYEQDADYATPCFCVLAVRCDTVEESVTGGGTYKNPFDGKTQHQPEIYRYDATVTVVGVPSALEAYGIQPGQQLRIDPNACVYNADGTPLFEPGKTYLIRGFYSGWSWYDFVQEDGTVTRRRREDPFLAPNIGFYRSEFSTPLHAQPHFGMRGFVIGDSPENLGIPLSEWDGVYRSYFGLNTADTIPFVVRYTGDWQDFLNTADGQIWRDVVIPWTQLNQNSVQLHLTEDVMSTYNFNTGVATLLDGRLITDEEYAVGADVCLVSSFLARVNGWQVGDTVNMELYSTELVARTSQQLQKSADGDYSYENGAHWVRTPVQPDAGLDITKNYTIVGIYTAPEFEYGLQNFPADTVFAPKASVQAASQHQKLKVHYANALVLENGSEEDFEQFMAGEDMGGYFTFCDQNYAAVHSAYTATVATAQRLAALGLAVLAVTAVVYHLLFVYRLAPVVRAARLIGVSARKLAGQIALTLLLHTVLAAVLGVVLTLGLYGRVAAVLLNGAALDVRGVLRFAAVAFGALAVIGVAAALPAARCDLMRRTRGATRARTVAAAVAVPPAPVLPGYSAPGAKTAATVIPTRPAATGAAAPGLQSMTLLGVVRRRGTAILLALLAFVGVLGSAVLLWQTDRQQKAWQESQADFVVRCTVTDRQGSNQQNLAMSSATLNGLVTGKLKRYAKDISALATEPLVAPEGYTLRRIMNIGSDEALTKLAGASVTMLAGWDDSAFADTQPVCLVPKGTAVAVGPDGNSYITVQNAAGVPTRLQVIGVVSRGPQNVIHVPMFLCIDGSDTMPRVAVNSCSFAIVDNSRMAEIREGLYDIFCDPQTPSAASTANYGLLINDEIYQTARAGVEGSIALFRVLLPLLVVGMELIGFFATVLCTAGRRREFAVMRCMGIRRRTIAVLVLEEQLLCALVGVAAGLVAAAVLPGVFTPMLWLTAGAVLLMFLVGGAIAAIRVTAVDVIKLMKVEE